MELEFFNECRYGKLYRVKELITQNINWHNLNDHHIFTPLMTATCNNQIEVVKFLLTQSIDINQTNEWENTCLFYGCLYKHTKIVELLVKDNRIDVTRIDKFDKTVLWRNCYMGNLKIIKILIASGRDLNYKQKTNNKLLPVVRMCFCCALFWISQKYK